MNNSHCQAKQIKPWVKPQILERAYLNDAEFTKHRGILEAIVLGVSYGPVS